MKKRKWWVILIKIVAFTVLACLLIDTMGKLVYPKNGRSYRIMKQQRESDAPDTMLLGTSVTYRGFVPLYYDALTGEDCLNLSTPAQTMPESRALLENTLAMGKAPKRLFLFMNIARLVRNNVSDYSYQVIENLPMGIPKIRLLLSSFRISQWPEALLKAYRARENFDLKKMRSISKRTGVPDVDPTGVPEELQQYLGKLYSSWEADAQDPDYVNLGTYDHFSVGEILPVNQRALDTIVSLCKQNGIKLILFSQPRLPHNAFASESWDDFNRYVTEYAEQNGIAYWNLMYLKDEVLHTSTEMFADGYHPNSTLAFPLTAVIAEMENKDKAGTLDLKDYLMDSYADYAALHADDFAPILMERDEFNARVDRYFPLRVTPAGDKTWEFRVSYGKTENGAYTVLSDWFSGDEADLSAVPRGNWYIMVESRDAARPGKIVYKKYQYTFK